MFSEDLFNKQMEDKIISFIESKLLIEFIEGKYSYLSVIYEVFAMEGATMCHKKVADKIHRLLSDISVKDLIMLSEKCRTRIPEIIWNGVVEDVNYRISYKNFKFRRDKFMYLSEEEYISILRLGTFHPNGFYRQMCIECLREYEDNLPFYILRMNDWVANIRALAYELSMKKMANDSVFVIFSSLPMINKVKNSGRRENEYISEILALAEKTILKKIPDCSLYDIVKSEVIIKNLIYKYLCENKILTLDKMKQLLKMEKTGYGKGMIANAIFNNYEQSIEEIDEYLSSKNAIVRFKAVEYKYDKLKQPWNGIESLLLDKSRRIRGTVSFILSRKGAFNVLEYYKNELKSENINTVAILGISECGSSKDVDVILPYLISDDVAIVKKALKAYGMLMTDNGSETYWEYLFNPSEIVSNEAYRLISKYNVHYGGKQLFEAYRKNKNSKLGEMLVALLLREGIWSNLKYLLLLYDDKNLSDNIIGLIHIKVSLRNNYYASLTPKQKEEIIDVMSLKKSLPRKLVDEILFDLEYI